jgi:hypothetical protein
MTQEKKKKFSMAVGYIHNHLFMFSCQICMKTWFICNHIAFWLMEHPIAIHFVENIDNYMDLYNFFFA